eukprot:225569-Rhodomonas_salina.3
MLTHEEGSQPTYTNMSDSGPSILQPTQLKTSSTWTKGKCLACLLCTSREHENTMSTLRLSESLLSTLPAGSTLLCQCAPGVGQCPAPSR